MENNESFGFLAVSALFHFNRLTSANITNTGSNGKLSGGVFQWSLCLTEPWTNLNKDEELL